MKIASINWPKKAVSWIVCLLLLWSCPAMAVQEDFYSWTWWSNKSGLTSGSLNDIIYTYLGNLGYTGTLNDRLHDWLVTETGLPSTYTLSDLSYDYFVINNSNPSSALKFLGSPLKFLNQSLTFP